MADTAELKLFDELHGKLSAVDYAPLQEQYPDLYPLGLGRTVGIQLASESEPVPTEVYARSVAGGPLVANFIKVLFIRDDNLVPNGMELYTPELIMDRDGAKSPTGNIIAFTPSYEALPISVCDVATSLGRMVLPRTVSANGELTYATEEELAFMHAFTDSPGAQLAMGATKSVNNSLHETTFHMVRTPAAS